MKTDSMIWMLTDGNAIFIIHFLSLYRSIIRINYELFVVFANKHQTQMDRQARWVRSSINPCSCFSPTSIQMQFVEIYWELLYSIILFLFHKLLYIKWKLLQHLLHPIISFLPKKTFRKILFTFPQIPQQFSLKCIWMK